MNAAGLPAVVGHVADHRPAFDHPQRVAVCRV